MHCSGACSSICPLLHQSPAQPLQLAATAHITMETNRQGVLIMRETFCCQSTAPPHLSPFPPPSPSPHFCDQKTMNSGHPAVSQCHAAFSVKPSEWSLTERGATALMRLCHHWLSVTVTSHIITPSYQSKRRGFRGDWVFVPGRRREWERGAK